MAVTSRVNISATPQKQPRAASERCGADWKERTASVSRTVNPGGMCNL